MGESWGVFDLSMCLLACGTVPGGHTQEENYPQTCSWLLYSDGISRGHYIWKDKN